MIAVVVVAVGGVGAGVVAVSGPRSPAPVVWHDQVADPTTTNAAGSPTATGDGRGGGDATSNSTTDPAGPGSTVPGSTGTSQPTSSTQLPTAGGDPLAGLRVAAEGPRTGYDRNLFGDWIDADHDRCDTREEILQAQSITPPQTDYSGTACKVMAGDWVSLYDGAVLTDRTEVQIDHVVALAEAWDSGASAWDATRRRNFANDLAHPELLAVSSSTNQAKSDHDPAEWSPPLASARCTFASDWVAVKVAWGLTADPAELTALQRMLATCPGGRPIPSPTPAAIPVGDSQTSPTTLGPALTTTTTLPPAAAGLLELSGLDCGGEGVTVHNGGSGSVDLSGWSIHDDGDKHTFAFPTGYHLAAGASVTVRSGGPAGTGELQWLNSTSPYASVWNNDGDTATLVDAGGTTRSTRSC